MGNFDFDQKISGGIAFCFILILGLVFAWHSISIGEELIKTTKENELRKAKQQLEMEKTQMLIEKQKKAKLQNEN